MTDGRFGGCGCQEVIFAILGEIWWVAVAVTAAYCPIPALATWVKIGETNDAAFS
jgi:hypothetical protein